MIRSELTKILAKTFPQLTAKDIELSIGVILNAISDKLAKGGRVEIRGFGSFSINVRPSRVGRNPKSGAKVYVPLKAVPHFKAGMELRARVNSLEAARQVKLAA